MAETINIAEIANKLSKDIFEVFKWDSHPVKDENFKCHTESHFTREDATHPCDVVFYYEDPYLNKTVYFNTDLKSYGKESITASKVRSALMSLSKTIECARNSEDWRSKFSITSAEKYEIRGLLFVHNHDGNYLSSFSNIIDKIDFTRMHIEPYTMIHFIAPNDIQRLYSIGNDIIRMIAQDDMSKEYTFYHPDLVMFRRLSDVWGQAATIESLVGPFFSLKHKGTEKIKPGYVVFYNRAGDTVEEFVYFLDYLSRYQMMESDTSIQVKVTHMTPSKNLRSNFLTAKKQYVQAWGFDEARENILKGVNINEVTSVTTTYNPGEMGWRE